MDNRLRRLTWSRDGSSVTVYSTNGTEGILRGRHAAFLSEAIEKVFRIMAEVNLDEIEQPEVDGGAGEADGERDALSGEPV